MKISIQSPVPLCPTGVKKGKSSLWLIACSFWLIIVNSVDNLAFSQNLSVPKDKVRSACTEQNVESLTTWLLRDLPSYTNRVTQRARRLSRSSEVYSYMLLAGRPEFTPLPLNPGIDTPEAAKSAASGVDQVFFTTLERQYLGRKAVELEEFHWLLLTKTQNGWRLVMMFTQTDSSVPGQPVSPPRDSSNSATAQAIKIWLRDCQAGTVRMGAVKGNR
ncbi:MAG: hypothetical protein RMY34_19080 [Aulosira sp. DedQUE10]|nr:hypothetical protein [Aulosira sp. DedQUE10]